MKKWEHLDKVPNAKTVRYSSCLRNRPWRRLGRRSRRWDALVSLHFYSLIGDPEKCGGGVALICSWWESAHAWVLTEGHWRSPGSCLDDLCYGVWRPSPSIPKLIRVTAHRNNKMVCVCVFPISVDSSISLWDKVCKSFNVDFAHDKRQPGRRRCSRRPFWQIHSAN